MSKFQKGHPGGPGRPRGSRNAINLILDQLAGEEAEKLLRDTIAAAADGDGVSRRLVLNRIWSAPKGRTLGIDLPEVRTPADLLVAHARVMSAIAGGSITPQEGASLSSVLETHRRAFELVAQEKRVEGLEAELRVYRKQLT
jgi:hypothetical protein